MRYLVARCAVVTLFTLVLTGVASGEEFKVKLVGTPDDNAKFLQQLNENGKEAGVTFVAAEADYQYRIALYAEARTGSDFFTGGGADASAVVLTPECEVAFIVTRGGRATKGGAMNALSKEIVKKLKAAKK